MPPSKTRKKKTTTGFKNITKPVATTLITDISIEYPWIATGDNRPFYEVASVWEVLESDFTEFAIGGFLGRHDFDDTLLTYSTEASLEDNTHALFSNLVTLMKDFADSLGEASLSVSIGHSMIIAACEGYTRAVTKKPATPTSAPPAVFTDKDSVIYPLGNPYAGNGYQFIENWLNALPLK